MKNADIVGRRIFFLSTPKIRDLEEFIALNRGSVRLHRNLIPPPKHAEEYLKVCGRWRDHERWAMLAEDGVS